MSRIVARKRVCPGHASPSAERRGEPDAAAARPRHVPLYRDQARPCPGSGRSERVRGWSAPESALWVADITYVPTLARLPVRWPSSSTCSAGASSGWAMAGHLRTALVVEIAGDQPWTNFGRSRSSITPIKVASTTSLAFERSLAGDTPASRCRMGSAPAIASIMRWPESFFATLECELLDRTFAVDATPKHGQRCSSSSRGGTTRRTASAHGARLPVPPLAVRTAPSGPALWTFASACGTPYVQRPRESVGSRRCARDPHRPQKLMRDVRHHDVNRKP